MATKDRKAAEQDGQHPCAYPVSVQQAAAAIFGIVPLGEHAGAPPLDRQINPKTDRENQ